MQITIEDELKVIPPEDRIRIQDEDKHELWAGYAANAKYSPNINGQAVKSIKTRVIPRNKKYDAVDRNELDMYMFKDVAFEIYTEITIGGSYEKTKE